PLQSKWLLGQKNSCQSLNQWINLYNETKSLLKYKFSLSLEEIQEHLYDHSINLLSIESVHENLVNHLEITLKKAVTVNCCNCLVKNSLFLPICYYFTN
ncbi:hypothetical protein VP01_6570g1, partial [Puccinia sorghi]